MVNTARGKRRSASKRLDLLARLRPLLRAPVESERMLRSVMTLLAVELGQYCIADLLDEHGTRKRVGVEHADPSYRARLRHVCDDASLPAGGRVARMLARGGSELVPRVTEATRARAVGDIVLLGGEKVRSYMASTVFASGTPVAVLTLVTSLGTRRYGRDDLAVLEEVADWTGLGLENALRRELEPRRSLLPPADDEAPVSRRTSSRKRGVGA
jgi:GAF domain-containing protein